MNHVRTKLRNKIRDQYLNDCSVIFIEQELLLQVNEDGIINRF